MLCRLMLCRVWYKVRNNYQLPTYAEATSMFIVRAANAAFECIIFSSIVYWMIGYSHDAGESPQINNREVAGISRKGQTYGQKGTVVADLQCLLAAALAVGCRLQR